MFFFLLAQHIWSVWKFKSWSTLSMRLDHRAYRLWIENQLKTDNNMVLEHPWIAQTRSLVSEPGGWLCQVVDK